jgi:hypothetical protein
MREVAVSNPNPIPEQVLLLSEEEAKLRTELYLQRRVEYQSAYYQRRVDEFMFNADKMLWFSAILMGVSAVISSSSIVADNAWLPFITALLPAFAAVLSAFRSLYQWERQASIYQSTWLALQQAKLALPDEKFLKPGDYARYFPDLVRQAEQVLCSEADQWGQLVSVEPAAGEAAPAEVGPVEPEAG